MLASIGMRYAARRLKLVMGNNRSVPNNQLVDSGSRISQNRVLIFLKSENDTQKFITQHGSITIRNTIIKARHLSTPAKKIILSNVSATIPNSVLSEHLINNFQVKLTSPLTILRVDPKDEEFGHIISNCRQAYVSNFNEVNLPSNFALHHNEHEYRIFVTSDEPVCFICRSNEHKASECTKMSTPSDPITNQDTFFDKSTTAKPINQPNNTLIPEINVSAEDNLITENFRPIIQTTSSGLITNSIEHPIELQESSSQESIEISIENNHKRDTDMEMDPAPLKRRISSSTSTTDTVPLQTIKTHHKKTKKKKEDEEDQSTSNDNINDNIDPLLEAKSAISQIITKFPDTIPKSTSTDDILEFIATLITSKIKDTQKQMKNYFQNPEELNPFFSLLHDYIESRTLKCRLTRIINLNLSHSDDNLHSSKSSTPSES